jgi:hypothetical protein
MDMKYTQKGYLHYILIVTALFMMFQFVYLKPQGFANWFLILVLLFLIFIILSSYKFSLELTDKYLIFKAGIGIITKTIPYEKIETSCVASTKWWTGIGLRFIGKGWLYNIKYGKTIEIQYKDKSMVTQFGFDEAEDIVKELNKRLTSNN